MCTCDSSHFLAYSRYPDSFCRCSRVYESEVEAPILDSPQLKEIIYHRVRNLLWGSPFICVGRCSAYSLTFPGLSCVLLCSDTVEKSCCYCSNLLCAWGCVIVRKPTAGAPAERASADVSFINICDAGIKHIVPFHCQFSSLSGFSAAMLRGHYIAMM